MYFKSFSKEAICIASRKLSLASLALLPAARQMKVFMEYLNMHNPVRKSTPSQSGIHWSVRNYSLKIAISLKCS